MQPEGHLVRGDSGGDLGVGHRLEPPVVQRAEQVERVALKSGIHAGRARDVEDRVPLVPQADAGIDGRQEPARPVGRAAADAAAGRHHDEGGQVLGFRAETVDDPRPQAGPAWLRETRVEEDLGGRVVELVGVDRLDDGDLVDHLGQVRQHLRELGAALAVPGELEARTEHGRVRADKRIPLTADDRGRERFAFELGQCRLGVEEVELAGCAGHEQVDDALRLRCEMRRFRCQRIVADSRAGEPNELARERIGQQAGQGDLADADTALPKEMAAGHGFGVERVRESWFSPW